MMQRDARADRGGTYLRVVRQVLKDLGVVYFCLLLFLLILSASMSVIWVGKRD